MGEEPWRGLVFARCPQGHRADVPAERPGRVDFALDAPAVMETSVEVKPPDAEAALPTCDPGRLAAIARAAGGVVLGPDQAEDLLRRLPAGVESADVEAQRTLWDSAAAFLAVLGLATLEWIVRKWHNLS
jgi:hypothetical protein